MWQYLLENPVWGFLYLLVICITIIICCASIAQGVRDRRKSCERLESSSERDNLH